MKVTDKCFETVATNIRFSKLSFSEIHSLLEQAEVYRVALLKYAPAQLGEKVKLKKTPNITQENAPGWMHAKHFLVKGAKATVSEINYYDNKFRLGLIFDNDTWIDSFSRKKNKTERKGMFMFSEDYIEKLDQKEKDGK